jgi:transposase-like protein
MLKFKKGGTKMTDNIMTLIDYLRKIGMQENLDFYRKAATYFGQKVKDQEAEEVIGAKKYERNDTRTNQRNGTRNRTLETRVGTIELEIPKLRKGSYFPSILKRRSMIEDALLTVVQEAYIQGISTRKMQKLFKVFGLPGIDKSKVSRICEELNEMVKQFRERALQSCYPYIWLDAVALKVRENHRVVNLSLAIAIGVDKQGERHILGFELGAGESEAFWTDFLRSLRERGLEKAMLVISDAHKGLVNALFKVISGAAWQRCSVHFMRNVLSQIAHKDKKQVAEALKLIFRQPDYRTAQMYLEHLAGAMQTRWPKASEMLLEAKEDILVYKTFPEEHHRSIHSVNPLERLNREIRRRERVVGVFPNRTSVYRLLGTQLMNVDEDWRAGRSYMGKEGIQKIFKTFPEKENKDFILKEEIINLEAQNAIYTT